MNTPFEQNLFPEKDSFSEKSNYSGYSWGGGSLNRYPNHFRESPFKMCMADMSDAYMGSADVYPVQAGEILAENNVSFQFVQEMIAYLDKNANGIKDQDEKELFRYDVKILVSKDASYLKEAFDKMQPAENDICFFLEDNSTDFFSDRKAYIKIGAVLQSDLRRQQIATIETQEGFFSRYTSYTEDGKEFALDFTDTDLQELITNGEISNPAMSLVIGIYQAINLQGIILGPLFGIISDALFWFTGKARDNFEFSEKSWNPYINGTENTEFKPILFGDTSTLLDLGAEGLDKVTSIVEEKIRAQIEELKSKKNTLIQPGLSKYLGSENLSVFLDTAIGYVEKTASVIFSSLDKMLEYLFMFGDKWLNICNAFYCGLWNSIVEIILGLIDLVGFLFKAMNILGNTAAEAQTLIPQALEIADEFLQTIMKIDIPDLLSSIFDKILTKLQNFNIYALTNSISIEQVAYFMGNIAGFVVELIIDAYFTVGTKAVVDLIKKFGTVSEKTLSTMASFITKISKGAKEFSAEAAMNIMQYIIKLMRGGKEEILKWIDEFFVLLEDAMKLGKEIIEEIQRIFGFSDSDMRMIEKGNYEFVTYSKNADKITCNLCIKPN